MKLFITLGNDKDMTWAQKTIEHFHYLKTIPHPQTRSMVYILWYAPNGTPRRLGLCMVGIPHATKNKRWYGVKGKPTQWQVVDLNRIWIDPLLQQGGAYCQPGIVPGFTDRGGVFRPTAASWLIGEVLGRVQRDRVAMWPPVFPQQPYHIRLAISYHDPAFHRGTIYKASGAEPMYTAVGENGRVIPAVGSNGKYGWVWQLPEPGWTWQEIEILRPRTLRMEFA